MWRPSWDSHELVSSETFWAIPPGIFIGISWGVLFQEISYNILFRNNSPFASGVFPGIPPQFLSVSDFKEIPLNIYLKIRICIASEIFEGNISGILFWFFSWGFLQELLSRKFLIGILPGVSQEIPPEFPKKKLFRQKFIYSFLPDYTKKIYQKFLQSFLQKILLRFIQKFLQELFYRCPHFFKNFVWNSC